MRAGALGDVLLLRRAVAALRAAGHDVTVMAPAAGAVLAGRGASEAGRWLSWDDPDMARLLGGGVRRPARLGEAVGACDLAVAYTRSAETIAGLRRIVRRVVAWDPHPSTAAGHASRWFAEAVADVAPVPDPIPSLLFSTEEQTEARRRTAALPPGFVAVHPGSGSPAKNWPSDRFVEVARRSAGGQPWLLALGPAEGATAAPPDAVVAREWPLRVLGAAMAGAGLFVGNDSGASHLAAASGAPTVALFGPTDPDVWSPVGDRVTVIRAPGGDLAALDVDTVLARINESRSLP